MKEFKHKEGADARVMRFCLVLRVNAFMQTVYPSA